MQHILCYIFILTLGCAFFVNAQPEDNRLIIVAEHMPPYQIIAAPGVGQQKVDGYSIDIIKHLLAAAKIEYGVIPMAWDRAYKFVQKKQNTLLLSVVRTPEREKMFHWLFKINTNNSGSNVWANAKSTKKLTSLTEITTEIIAVNRNDHQHLLLKQYPNISKKNILITDSKEQAIALVVKNRADYFIANEQVLAWRLKALGLQKQDFNKAISLKENINELYIVANIDTSPLMINKLHHAYTDLVASKQLQVIKQRWF